MGLDAFLCGLGIFCLALLVPKPEQSLLGHLGDALGVAVFSLFSGLGPTFSSVRLMSTPRGAGKAGQNSILYFTVSDIAGPYAALVARGAKHESGPNLAAKMPDHDR